MKCRIWWPTGTATGEPSSDSGSSLLFGWFISCSPASLDVVVAFSRDEASLPHHLPSPLHETLRRANERMPVALQEKAVFCTVGKCVWPVDSCNCEVGEQCGNSGFDGSGWSGLGDCYGKRDWIVMGNVNDEATGIGWHPMLDHVHWGGRVHTLSDVHVILYETPLYGVRYYSLNYRNLSNIVKSTQKKPKWVEEIHGKDPLFDMETVILAINSAAAITSSIVHERCTGSWNWACALRWKLLAVTAASISTVFYIIFQLLGRCFRFGSSDWQHNSLLRIFETTLSNIRCRCCQILYWPVFLQDNGIRSTSCVEYAEKAALYRNSVWSSLAVDLLLGNVIGLVLLMHVETTWLWIFNFGEAVTNELLRSGCVWLMGIPAGFKLNMELAGVLGMISLDVIQIWSTLWVFLGYFFAYFIKGLAVLGILFGATIPAALTIDMTRLASLHVLIIHWGLSVSYSKQTQAIASLWRLFRGRKWNPLRQRLDSYDYGVKQHIVGSLMFTPLLLLLPTTSVFYIFFTILNTSIMLFCVLMEIAISIIHGTPYVKILIWLLRRRRFPSGIWFDIVTCKTESKVTYLDEEWSSSNISVMKRHKQQKRSSNLVSFLQSNFLSLGEVVWPHYENIFSGVSGFLVRSSYGALTGKRTASTLGCRLPADLPWIYIPTREYWSLCYNSILTCLAKRDCLA